MPGDHAGNRPIIPHCPSWVGEDNPGLFECQTGDRPPRDLCHGPLKERREEYFLQHTLHHLEGHPTIRGDALHKRPLLLEGLLQDRVCSLRMPKRHPGEGGHQIPPYFHFLPQIAVLRLLGPHKTRKLAASCHNLKSVSPEEGLLPQDVPGRHNQDYIFFGTRK